MGLRPRGKSVPRCALNVEKGGGPHLSRISSGPRLKMLLALNSGMASSCASPAFVSAASGVRSTASSVEAVSRSSLRQARVERLRHHLKIGRARSRGFGSEAVTLRRCPTMPLVIEAWKIPKRPGRCIMHLHCVSKAQLPVTFGPWSIHWGLKDPR